MTNAAAPANKGSILSELDDRARAVFRQIVESYLETGEPVGSRTISRQGVNLSPASIRNVMSDLAEQGLLDAPHASAGRMPTHLGLRVFVDGLLQVGELSKHERAEIDARLAGTSNNPEAVLDRASDLLSGLAGGAGLVSSPSRDPAIQHIEFIRIGADQALAVIVDADGVVENRMISLPTGLPASALIEASNYLNARLKGKTLAEARTQALETLSADRAALDVAAAKLIEAGFADWSGEDPSRGRLLIVRGRANLIQDATAQADLDRVKSLFDDLERQQTLLTVLDGVGEGDGVRLFIGAENPLFSLSGSSLIVAPYMSGGRTIIGALGVIGPTRINYARVIPVVDYTAQVVGRMLDGPSRQEDE